MSTIINQSQIAGIKYKASKNKFQKKIDDYEEQLGNLKYENRFLQNKNTKLERTINELNIDIENERIKITSEYNHLTEKYINMKEDFEEEKEYNSNLENDLRDLKYKNKEKITKIVEKFKILDKFKNESCSICLEVSGEKMVTDCGHTFHKQCLSKVRNDLCPMCRNKVSYELFTFNSNPIEFEYSIV